MKRGWMTAGFALAVVLALSLVALGGEWYISLPLNESGSTLIDEPVANTLNPNGEVNLNFRSKISNYYTGNDYVIGVIYVGEEGTPPAISRTHIFYAPGTDDYQKYAWYNPNGLTMHVMTDSPDITTEEDLVDFLLIWPY
ncbi:MAG TPA: hypothetical protein ENI92_01070 [Bacteroidetes bacterium]|nr:hypothetical protein [Bacteroidota bacterium]